MEMSNCLNYHLPHALLLLIATSTLLTMGECVRAHRLLYRCLSVQSTFIHLRTWSSHTYSLPVTHVQFTHAYYYYSLTSGVPLGLRSQLY
jgi:hypothetical protein